MPKNKQNLNQWLNHPAMKSISPAKKELLNDFINEADGLPMDKMLPVYMKTNAKMKALGLSFTKEENDLITQILTENLSPMEKERINTIMKLIPH